ncbi:hypothetical protein BKA69DRAFT_1124416 [Paraphysoderma sedebokerense]|nr:hypothetical protein BKA69DRAFT_1124416 [Paraphysoderma sedebokerense]
MNENPPASRLYSVQVARKPLKQLSFLTRFYIKTKLRSPARTISVFIIIPAVLILLLASIVRSPDKIDYDQPSFNVPAPTSLLSSYSCPSQDCVHFGYTGVSSEPLLKQLKANTALYESNKTTFRTFETYDEMKKFHYACPGCLAVGVYVVRVPERWAEALALNLSDTGYNFQYVLFGDSGRLATYSTSAQLYIELTAHMMDKKLLQVKALEGADAGRGNASQIINTPDIPPFKLNVTTVSAPISQRRISILYGGYVSVSVLAISLILTSEIIFSVAAERRESVKTIMDVMGLSPPVYWTAHFLSCMPFVFLTVVCSTLCMYFAKVFPTNNPVFLPLLLLHTFIHILSVVSFGLLFSIRSRDPAAPIGIAFGIHFFTFIFLKDFIMMDSWAFFAQVGRIIIPIVNYGRNVQLLYDELYRSSSVSVAQLMLSQLGTPLLMFVVYALLVVYLDLIAPGGCYATREKDYFFFLKSSYWLRDRLLDEKRKLFDWDKERVVISKLKKNFYMPSLEYQKSYEKVVALNELNLEFQFGETTVLLGHNGAGKSTLLSILSGTKRPNSGSIHFGNLSISNPFEFRIIHENTGFCPQHSALYSNLTVIEHLKLFSALRGVSVKPNKSGIEVECNNPEEYWLMHYLRELLFLVELSSKEDELVKNLSGGMKRKLSLAISLIGDPKILILDEVTAGMDIMARRKMWSLLDSMKTSRLILLSTHDMEEASILGDKIAILSRGRTVKVGEVGALKMEVGGGIKIAIEKCRSNEKVLDVDMLQGRLNDTLGETSIDVDTTSRVVFSLPRFQSSDRLTLAQLLDDFATSKEELGIAKVSTMMPTLEEAFLHFSNEHVHDEDEEDVDLKEKPEA